MNVSLNELPGVSALFSDYIARRDSALALFRWDPFSEESAAELASALAKNTYSRSALSDVLLEQNQAWGAQNKTLENCRKLKEPSCLAVVTGQQTGLFGGPMYTAVKALHTIRLAEAYERTLGVPVVPVFWMELQDHDLAEISSVTILTKDNTLETLTLQVENSDGNRKPVNDIPAGTHLDGFVDSLQERLQKTEFSADLFQLLRRCYSSERSLSEGFARFFTGLFSRHGLVLYDPSDSRLKKNLTDLFIGEIKEPGTSIPGFAEQMERISKAGYHQQVSIKADALNLFMLREGSRYRLARQTDRCVLSGTEVSYGLKEITDLARSSPECFIPSVLLRPVAQDCLLPTLAYIAGPSEVAYLAQTAPMYENAGVQMPLVIPRAGATVIGGAVRRNIKKLDIAVNDILKGRKRLFEQVMASTMPADVPGLFETARRDVSDSLGILKSKLKNVDAGFLQGFEKSEQKIDYQISRLREKFQRNLEANSKTLVQRVKRIVDGILPDGKLQERVFPVAQLINSYGPAILELIAEKITPNNPAHHFIEV